MGLFDKKNNNEQFIGLKSFYDYFSLLLNKDTYISKRDYQSGVVSIKKTVDSFSLLKEQEMLNQWCKKNKCSLKDVESFLDTYINIEKIVNKHNEQFLKKHLDSDRDYLNNVLKDDDPRIVLDEEQRRVVLSDEDYTLVIAGAGAGKTTTIEAKVKYLVEKKNIDPERILIVSFTKKATTELQERMDKLSVPVKIATFHSIGNTLIKQNEQVHHKIVDGGFMFDTIRDYLLTKLEDESYIKKIVLFFASYLNMPFNEENTALMYRTLNENNTTTLRSDVKALLDDYQKKQTSSRRTINDESVRSLDECRIANFLFIHGVDYVYEPVYRYGFKNSTKPYCPDFLIKQGDKEIYLEHFGISEDGKNNRFTEKELEEYKKHANEKVSLHSQHGTKLIYTFSKYKDNRDLIVHLEELLKKEGIVLDTKNDMDIYRKIAENVEQKYFNKFISLICSFISRMKTNNYSEDKFDYWSNDKKDERTKLFLSICKICFHRYSAALKEEGAIDFEDMINNASNILDKCIKSGEKLPYDYILVDEYQDISLQRFDLCEKLGKASDAKIIAVGDDWQSIFKFSGAQIDLFTHFKERMGYANVLKITKTYRNSQELIDIAGGFVMENNEQIKKTLRSNKTIKNPVILMSYDDSNTKDENEKGPYYRLGEAIVESIGLIVDHNKNADAKILLIGRYNFDGGKLSILEDLFECNNKIIKCKEYPNVTLDFLTAHSSKGLGYDNVIIINGKDDVLGFPSKIEDDPVMKLVIKDDESIEFAEERRLFYVALTRTKNRVYIIAPQNKPSKFILEIKDKYTNVILKGNQLNPTDDPNFRYKCPNCGYPLQRRVNKNFSFAKKTPTLYICSNDPEVCGFLTNDIKGGKLAISKCPNCEDGYLFVKKIKDKEGKDTGHRFLGCTNYKEDKTGCNTLITIDKFTQDKSRIIFYDKKANIDNVNYCGMPFKEFIVLIEDTLIHLQERNFLLSFNQFKELLIGAENNINKYMNSCPGYKKIDKQYEKQIWPIIKYMLLDEYVVEVQEKSFKKLKLVNRLTEDDYGILFSKIKDTIR